VAAGEAATSTLALFETTYRAAGAERSTDPADVNALSTNVAGQHNTGRGYAFLFRSILAANR
jgi:hypothetical protein